MQHINWGDYIVWLLYTHAGYANKVDFEFKDSLSVIGALG